MDVLETNQRLAALMEARLGMRGADLAAKTRRAGRLLPKHLRKDAAMLIEAEQQSDHPALRRQMDLKALEKSADRLSDYLCEIDPIERIKAQFLTVAASIAFVLLILTIAVVVTLRWRGFV